MEAGCRLSCTCVGIQSLPAPVPSSRIDPSPGPFLPADSQVHGQAWDHLLLLSAPLGSSEEPVRQCHNSGCSVGAVVFVRVLDRVCGDPSFAVKGENEHARELVPLAQIEDRFVPAQKLAQSTIDRGVGIRVAWNGAGCGAGM